LRFLAAFFFLAGAFLAAFLAEPFGRLLAAFLAPFLAAFLAGAFLGAAFFAELFFFAAFFFAAMFSSGGQASLAQALRGGQCRGDLIACIPMMPALIVPAPPTNDTKALEACILHGRMGRMADAAASLELSCWCDVIAWA
jgi:hypothetical protein